MKFDPLYWRHYYKAQEMLAKNFLDEFTDSGNIGDVRNQSTLPHSLNKKAHEIASLMETDEEFELDNKTFLGALKGLDKDLRLMIDDIIVADELIRVKGKLGTLGGFGLNRSGYINGFFSLKKGNGSKLFDLIVKEAIKFADKDVTMLTMNCYSGKMLQIALDKGFIIANVFNWDDKLAPKGWNYDKFGRPSVYELYKEIK